MIPQTYLWTQSQIISTIIPDIKAIFQIYVQPKSTKFHYIQGYKRGLLPVVSGRSPISNHLEYIIKTWVGIVLPAQVSDVWSVFCCLLSMMDDATSAIVCLTKWHLSQENRRITFPRFCPFSIHFIASLICKRSNTRGSVCGAI